jgi:DNA-binding MarR family transcriptional regulator
MVQNSYLLQEPSAHDRRSSHVKLSEKGIKLHDKLDELFTMHAKALAHEGIDANKATQLDNMLTTLEGFWTSLLTRDLRR